MNERKIVFCVVAAFLFGVVTGHIGTKYRSDIREFVSTSTTFGAGATEEGGTKTEERIKFYKLPADAPLN